jgi:hypothetical protein
MTDEEYKEIVIELSALMRDFFIVNMYNKMPKTINISKPINIAISVHLSSLYNSLMIITEGYDEPRKEALDFLDKMKKVVEDSNRVSHIEVIH